ncbi:MAG: hypothetical protein K6E88_10985 [Lachnospiraceae bacterium]|nr:hypothetical protein [Lachnospiraceae bacterium]
MKKKDKRPTQINLMIRCIIAMYLIYLAHSIISDLGSAPNARMMLGFAIAFTFAGVLILAFTIKAFINKDYKDMMDLSDDEDTVVDAGSSETEGTVIDEIVTDDAVVIKKEAGKSPEEDTDSGETDTE